MFYKNNRNDSVIYDDDNDSWFAIDRWSGITFDSGTFFCVHVSFFDSIKSHFIFMFDFNPKLSFKI